MDTQNKSVSKDPSSPENPSYVQDHTALGLGTLAFIVGYIVGSGRWRKALENGSRLFGSIGLITFDRAADRFFEEKTHRAA